MEVLVLASGSSGNAAVVADGSTTLLLDAGISALAIRQRLAAFGRSENELSAAVLTHEHSDHIRGIEVLQRRRPLPVWATTGTWQGLAIRAASGGELCSGTEVTIGSLRVLPVATSHDAREPVALIISNGSHRIGLCTDTGIVTSLLGQRLAGCDLLLLEANHDADLLRHGPYPWPLKQRISSRLGHLANHQVQEAFHDLRSERLRGVVAMHLSEHNNRPELVRQVLHEAVGSLPLGIAGRHRMVRVSLDGSATSIEQRDAPPSRRAARCASSWPGSQEEER